MEQVIHDYVLEAVDAERMGLTLEREALPASVSTTASRFAEPLMTQMAQMGSFIDECLEDLCYLCYL